MAFDVFVNDGIDQFAILQDGRLWKRDVRSAVALLFDDDKVKITLNTKGRLLVRAMAGDHHAFGYRLAAEAVRTRAAKVPAGAAVISTIGTMPVVVAMRAFANAFAAAA